MQGLLGPDEALLAWVVDEEQTHLLAVRSDGAAFTTALMGRAALSDAVGSLRRALDPAGLRDVRDLLRFDAKQAHALYAALFSPVASLLEGAQHVFVVPDGPLESLPVGILLTEAPAGGFEKLEDFRGAPWLARKLATTVLPSVSSLRALRVFAKASGAKRPFLDVGDPLLKDHRPRRRRGRSCAPPRSRSGSRARERGFPSRAPSTAGART